MVFVFTLRQVPRRHGTRYPYGPCCFIALAALCILAGMYIINIHISLICMPPLCIFVSMYIIYMYTQTALCILSGMYIIYMYASAGTCIIIRYT